MLRKELKEKFIQEFTPSEQFFFLNKAKEAITQKGYPACEDLFQYVYFLTIQKRMRSISSEGGEGYMRILLVEGTKDIEEAIKLYKKRLDKKRLSHPDPAGYKFIEYFSQ